MSEHQEKMLKESLSALLDNEAQELETRRVLNEMDKDAELKSTWQNYQMIGDLMRNEVSSPMDLTDAINQQIDGQEAMPEGQMTESTSKSWMRPFTSVAVAASVTLAVLLGVQMGGQESSPVTIASQATSVTPAAVEVAPNEAAPSLISGSVEAPVQVAATDVVAPAGENAEDLEQAQQKLQEYLMEHTENAAGNTNRGALPYARVVKFGEQQEK